MPSVLRGQPTLLVRIVRAADNVPRSEFVPPTSASVTTLHNLMKVSVAGTSDSKLVSLHRPW